MPLHDCNSSDNELWRQQNCCAIDGHVRYEMESNHIQIMMRGKQRVELAQEENNKDCWKFSNFLAYMVQPYTIVSMNVLGIDR